MTYELHDEKRQPPAERRTERNMMRKEVEKNPIVAVEAEVVWRQPTSPSGGRYRNSLFG